MINKLIITLFSVILFSTPTLLFSQLTPSPVGYSHEDFPTVIEKSQTLNKFVFVTFSAQWCLPCQIMEEAIDNNPLLVSVVKKNFIPVKADVDENEGKKWQEEFAVMCLPTIIVLNPKGEQIARHDGGMTSDDLLYFLQEVRYGTNNPVATTGGSKNDQVNAALGNATYDNVATLTKNNPSQQEKIMKEGSSSNIANTNSTNQNPSTKGRTTKSTSTANNSIGSLSGYNYNNTSTKYSGSSASYRPSNSPVIGKPIYVNDHSASNGTSTNSIRSKGAASPASVFVKKSKWAIQVGMYRSLANANKKIKRIQTRSDKPVYLVTHYDANGLMYKVAVGDYAEIKNARDLRNDLSSSGVKGYLTLL